MSISRIYTLNHCGVLPWGDVDQTHLHPPLQGTQAREFQAMSGGQTNLLPTQLLE